MPETAIDEDCDSIIAEQKIGVAHNWRVKLPTSDASAYQSESEPQLSGFVVASANGTQVSGRPWRNVLKGA